MITVLPSRQDDVHMTVMCGTQAGSGSM